MSDTHDDNPAGTTPLEEASASDEGPRDLIRDLAIREVLGLVDELETARLEEAFESMSPHDQAAVLDLQAAVAREIVAAGVDRPDRAVRYRVLARLSEEMETESATGIGPIATIGRGRRGPGRGEEGSSDQKTPAGGTVTGLQADRLRRSAFIWRAAAFALGSAVLALGVLQQQAQHTLGSIVDHLNDRTAASDLVAMAPGSVKFDLERLLMSGTAESTALVSSEPGFSGLLLTESAAGGSETSVLLLLNLPEEIGSVRVTRIDEGGDVVDLGVFDTNLRRQFAALTLETGGLAMGGTIEVRDSTTGRLLLTTVA